MTSAIGRRVLLALLLGLVAVPAVSGCTGSQGAPDQQQATTAQATLSGAPGGGIPDMGAMPAEMQAMWAARPEYVRGNVRTEEAYAYALTAPDALQWMPCYCGCAGMGHLNNLDCYVRREGTGIAFEEHASYCQLCVETTLMVKHRIAQGEGLRSIRAAVDQTFGGAAPGTPTELPPA